MAQLKENAINIFNYVKKNEGNDITAQDIANALGLGIRQVNGIITGAFSNRKDANNKPTPVMVREEAEVEITDDNGNVKHQPIKLVKLTEYGRKSTVESLDADDAKKTAARAAAAAKDAE